MGPLEVETSSQTQWSMIGVAGGSGRLPAGSGWLLGSVEGRGRVSGASGRVLGFLEVEAGSLEAADSS